MELRVLADQLAVCRLPAGSPVPEWISARSGGSLRSVTWSPEETSIVCARAAVPEGIQVEHGWRALAVVGPLDFSLTGVLAALAQPLAAAGISIFALSTYDTDYLLVKARDLGAAIEALEADGHEFAPDREGERP